MLLRSLFLAGLVSLLLPLSARATFITFTNRTAWETAAASAGLTVLTNDFSTSPFPSFTLGGISFSGSGLYDVGNQRVRTGPNLTFDFTSGTNLYGLAIDLSSASGASTGTATLRGTDEDGLFGTTSSSTFPSFIGILSDVPLDPACGAGACGGGPEFTATATAGFLIGDNLSVAVPEPGSLALIGLGLIGLVAARRWSRRA